MIILAQATPEGRVFGLDSQTLIQIGIQLLNCVILAAVLTFILYKPVKNFMKKRSEKIQGDIESANSEMTKAAALIDQYEAKIESINQERAELLEDTRRKAEDEKSAILKQAAKEAVEIKKQSLEEIAQDRNRLEREMRIKAAELSFFIAEKYIAMNMDDNAQNKYFEQMMAKLEEA